MHFVQFDESYPKQYKHVEWQAIQLLVESAYLFVGQVVTHAPSLTTKGSRHLMQSVFDRQVSQLSAQFQHCLLS
jgi:hypothetical protein